MPIPIIPDAAALRGVLKRDDLRALWPHPFSAEVALLFGEAFAARLAGEAKAAPEVVVGYDARAGSLELALAFSRGVRQSGGRVAWLGLVSTEHVYYMTGRYRDRYAGGAMVTASHNPKDYNGIKLVFAGARPLSKAELEAVCDEAARRLQPPQGNDPRAEFAEFALDCAAIPALPRTAEARYPIVVAAGNGVGGHAFGPLAERLEAWGFRCTFLDADPDGDFPHGVPNPLLPGFVRRLRREVRARRALLGIGFDGDGDRAGFVDSSGREITGSQVLALTAESKLAAMPGPAVVMRNLCCSQLLVDLLAARPGVTLIDTPVGHGKIKLLMRHDVYRERIVVAGEHSGHYFYPEFFHVDSGMLTALYMLRRLATESSQGRRLEERLRPWRRRYVWSGELNYTLPSTERTLEVLAALDKACATPAARRYEVGPATALGGLEAVTLAGAPYAPETLASPDLKLEFVGPGGRSGWWFVARPSGNEPMLRLNVESWGVGAARHTAARVDDLEQIIVRLDGRRVR
jgi:phosphomannomutase